MGFESACFDSASIPLASNFKGVKKGFPCKW